MNKYRRFEDCRNEKGQMLANLKRNCGSGSIYLFKMMDGQEFRISTKIKTQSCVLDTSTYSRVQKKANLLITIGLREKKQEKPHIWSIKSIIGEIYDIYMKQMNAGSYAKGSFEAMERSFERIILYWGDKFPTDINRENWDKFQSWHESKWPKQDQFNVTKYMRVLRTYCLEREYIRGRPKITDRYAKARREIRKKKKSRVYTTDEIIALDMACENDYERLSLRLAYMMAFRISDCIQLKWSRVFLEEDPPIITFSEGEDKADFSGKVPIADDVVDILKNLSHESDWIFFQEKDKNQHIKTQQIDFKKIRRVANITHGTFHSLRHFRLSEDFNNPLFTSTQVCLIRRVSMQTAMEHYIHVRKQDLELLRNAGKIKL